LSNRVRKKILIGVNGGYFLLLLLMNGRKRLKALYNPAQGNTLGKITKEMQSLSKLYVHIVFHIQYNVDFDEKYIWI